MRDARGISRPALPIRRQSPGPTRCACAYLIAFARPPADDELADAVAFLDEQQKLHAADGKTDSRQLALADFCQVLFGLNEFVYVE